MAEEEKFFKLCPACGEPLPEGRSVHSKCVRAAKETLQETEGEES